MRANSKASAVVTYRFNASPETIFDAWLDPEIVKKWMFPKGDIVSVDIDARLGGAFSFVDLRDGEEIDHTGEYLEMERPRRLVFTWGIPAETPDTDRVMVDIAQSDSGSELTLTHELDPNWAEYVPQAEQAWRTMLEAMDEAIV